MKNILKKLYSYQTLTYDEARETLHKVSSGEANDSQIASFVTIYLLRPITIDELRGFRDVLLDKCLAVELPDQTIDVCGTGGDEKNTFNISTLSAFVLAGAGIKVAKHGNYGVSSVSGSSNVLEHFGYQFTADAHVLRQQLADCNLCFMHAPLFHPALKAVAPIRKQLGIKTFFNMLGPLVNPAKPHYRMVGVYNLEIARMYHYLLQSEQRPYCVVHALGGYDEISLTGEFKTFSQQGEQIFHPNQLNLAVVTPESIFGGDTVEESAEIFKSILTGNGTQSQNAVVLANTAFAIQTVTQQNFANCYKQAQDSLLSGKAYGILKQLSNG
jgi:anthranilate phosphoribosyltransferase